MAGQQTGQIAPTAPRQNKAGWLGLAAAYFSFFGLLGTLQPYLSTLYLEHGLPASAVGASVALLYILAGLAPLAAMAMAARWQLGARKVFALSAGFALILALGLVAVGANVSHLGYVCLIAALTAAYAPLNALLDTSALHACNEQGWSFGRLRLMGSLGYIVTATVLGKILPLTEVSGRVHVAVAAMMAAVFCAGFWLPNIRVQMATEPQAAASAAGAAVAPPKLAPSPMVLGCLLTALGLYYASFGPFQYGFTLYGRSVGLSPMAIGLGWSLGVVSEVCVFSLAGGWLNRWSWRPLLVVAFLVAPLRWILLAALPHPVTFFVSQLAHGPSFALFYAAAMAALDEVAPTPRARRSQTIFSALAAGLASGPAMLLAGYAYAFMSLGSMFACMLPANLLAFILLAVALRRSNQFRRAERVDQH